MRVEHIEFRISQQQAYITFIKRAYDNILNTGLEKIPRSRIETRHLALKEEWEKFTVNNDAINLALSRIDPANQQRLKQHSYFKEDLYAKTYECYLDTVEKIMSLKDNNLDTSIHSVRNTTALHSSIPVPPYPGPRLPRIDLPKFNGDLADWLPFRDLFSSLVLSNPSLSAVEKLQYLKTSLDGSAARLLKNTALTSDNFEKSWDALISFYENRRLLVNSALQSLFAIKRMSKESATELEHLYTSIMQIYRTLETLHRPVDSWDDILVFMIVQRLDSESVKAWEHHLGSSKEPPSWKQVQEFLMTRMLSLQAFEKSQNSKASAQSQQRAFRSHLSSQRDENSTYSDSKLSCPLCSAEHYLYQCSEYQQKLTHQRIDYVNSKKLCYNCIGSHRSSSCRSTRRCMKCGRKHHTTLHRITTENPSAHHSDVKTVSLSIQDEGIKQINHSQTMPMGRSIALLATAQVKIRNHRGETIQARALLDQGSEISLISENLVQRLNIRRHSCSVPVLGIGEQKSGKTRGIVSLMIQPHFQSSQEITLQAYILPKLTSVIPSSQNTRSNWPHLKGLLLADPNFTEPGKTDLLIGADMYGQLLEGPIIKGPINSPVAQLTQLGWIISGPSSTIANSQELSANHCARDHDLHSLLESFWRQEEIPSPEVKPLSVDDQECENHFVETHSRNESGRYIVRLPFKHSPNQLGDSKPSSLQMLNRLQTKFESDPAYFNAYSLFLKEYESLSHMTHVSESEFEPYPVFYLPHHGVVKDDSLTTKLRVVFNGSCRVKGGLSLNEALHSGPKLQNDLFDVLLWMRQFRYIFSSDMEKMYRQIQLHASDWKFQRIFWKEDGSVLKYQLTTLTYGLTCAPFLALRCMIQLVKDEGHQFPLAVDVLLKGRYVDDVFGGAYSIKDAQERACQVKELCLAGGFPLRKWISNHPDVIELIPTEHKINTDEVPIKDHLIHALGLSWNPSLDVFQFNLSLSPLRLVTKRTVLSRIAQFFDPMGFLSPLFIRAKILMQELWAIKISWDDQLGPPQLQTWQIFLQSLEGLEGVQIPRWIGTMSTSDIEIHGFCDASQLAMAAVIYLKTKHQNQKATISVLCSKTKVAPLKRLTIPRLELSAAVMLTKLVEKCVKILSLRNVPCILWTDATIVHTWLNNHPSRWKEFVHNRVCFIQETLPHAQWKHVPGNSNPADCATRGVSAKELQNHALWWTGPTWLSEDSSTWPSTSLSLFKFPTRS